MVRIGKGRRTLMLLLPLLLGFAFQATQYARAPVEYNYYVVYAKNADIALKPGIDLSSSGTDGGKLLHNSTTQQGLYSLTLGKWSPGYMINYTDAFRVYNREVFSIKMIGFNFTTDSIGKDYVRLWVQNDTNNDGTGDAWVKVWDGSTATLNANNYIYIKATSTYGNDGGFAKIRIDLVIPDTGIGLANETPELTYTGEMRLWFTSASF